MNLCLMFEIERLRLPVLEFLMLCSFYLYLYQALSFNVVFIYAYLYWSYEFYFICIYTGPMILFILFVFIPVL